MPTPLTGQISVTGTAQAVSTTPVTVAAWVLKTATTNQNPIFIGPEGITTSTGHQLDPGDSIEYERSFQNGAPRYMLGPSDVYVVGTSGDKTTWFGSPA